jgi:hypothetical protein
MEGPRLLASDDAQAVHQAPFAHVVVAPAIDAPVYERLAAAFPALERFSGHGDLAASNRAIRMNAADVARDDRVVRSWRDFFAYHTSAEHWHDIVRVFGESLRREYPDLEDRIGRPYRDWRAAPRGTDAPADVRLDCQFVVNTPVTARSSVKTAHVDKYDKIFSALFYLPDPRERGAGGDLELYAWRRAPRFVKHRVLDRDVEPVKTIAYAPNTYVAFVNSPRSVHGVSPRAVTDVPRRYVNFVAEVPRPAFRPKQVGPLLRLVRAVAPASGDDAY